MGYEFRSLFRSGTGASTSRAADGAASTSHANEPSSSSPSRSTTASLPVSSRGSTDSTPMSAPGASTAELTTTGGGGSTPMSVRSTTVREPPPMPPSPSSASQSEDGDEEDDDEDDEEEFDDLRSSSLVFGGRHERHFGAANAGGLMSDAGESSRLAAAPVISATRAGKARAMDEDDAGLEYSPENTIDRRNTITSRNGIYHISGVTASGSRTSLMLRQSNGGPATPGLHEGSPVLSKGHSDAPPSPDVMAQTPSQEMQTMNGISQHQLPFNPAAADSLPHEIMLHIFRFVLHSPSDLRRCILVCKSWCLSGVELLWHRPAFYKASSLYKMVHTLSLPNQTFEYATFIRRLNFSVLGGELDNATFQRMASCVRLERLTLTGCTQLTDAHVARVVERTPHLVATDLSDVVNIGDETIYKLAAGCERLQGINLTRCILISTAAVAELGRNCKMLRRVKLGECVDLEDDAISALAENCPLLLEIDLVGCSKVTDEGVAKLWTHSSQIREFRLNHCVNLTNAGFPTPLSGKRRRDGGVLSNGIVRAPLVPDHLLEGTDHNDMTILPGAIPLRSFDHLRLLDLTGCSHITDHAIEGIINNAPKIRNLILAKCSLLTDEAIYSIANLGKNLHFLHLSKVDKITDRAIKYLARTCTRLRYIDLAYCPHLTDDCIKDLAHNLPKLRRIGLVKLLNLTDEALYHLVDRHTSLERIHLSYCERITVPAVFWLVFRLERLTHLSLTGVPAFKRDELQAMCRTPPKEYTEHQRNTFCVYSGKCIGALRDFLTTVYEDGIGAEQYGPLPPHIASALAAYNEQQARHQARTDHRQWLARHQQGASSSSRPPPPANAPAFSAAELHHLRVQYEQYMAAHGFHAEAQRQQHHQHHQHQHQHQHHQQHQQRGLQPADASQQLQGGYPAPHRQQPGQVMEFSQGADRGAPVGQMRRASEGEQRILQHYMHPNRHQYLDQHQPHHIPSQHHHQQPGSHLPQQPQQQHHHRRHRIQASPEALPPGAFPAGSSLAPPPGPPWADSRGDAAGQSHRNPHGSHHAGTLQSSEDATMAEASSAPRLR